MQKVEPYTPLNGSVGNSATLGGRRKKMKLVTKKKARRVLRKLGMKFRGGAEDEAVAVPKEDLEASGEKATAGRRRGKKTARKSRRSIFGMKY
jgi:hypothetical protein